MKPMSFDSPPPSDMKDVDQTKQLEPLTGQEFGQSDNNDEGKRYTAKTKDVGKLGNKGFAE